MTEPGETLCFRDPHGKEVEAVVVQSDHDPHQPEPPLRSCLLTLEYADGTHEEVRQVAPPESGPGIAYRALDNEIMAGLRLSRLCESRPYPTTVTRLVGYEADGVLPYVLLEPCRGRPIGATTGAVLPGDRVRFQEGVLTGLRWLCAAGIAHRAISPYTVYWDGTGVQITDFATATLVGAPRSAAGAPPWQPPEQRSDPVTGITAGTVTDKDDVWAAGRLIFCVTSGRELTGPHLLDDDPELARVLGGVFGPMDGRPTVRDLLGRLNIADPVPRVPPPGADFQRGRAAFFALRSHKHPGIPPLDEPEPQPVPQQAAVVQPAGTAPPGSAVPRRLWRRGR